MKKKELPSQKTQENILQVQKIIQAEQQKLLKERQEQQLKEKDQNYLRNLQLNLENLKIKLEYQLRTEKKLQRKEQQQIQKKLNEFVDNDITWKLKEKSFLYPVWEGTYNGVHVFNITKKQMYFELSLVFKGAKSKEMKDVQKQANLLLESIVKKEDSKNK